MKEVNIKPMTMWDFEQNEHRLNKEYRSADLTQIGTSRRREHISGTVDIEIRAHQAKGGRFYTMNIGGKAIERLNIKPNSVVSFHEHSEKPDFLYIKAGEHSGKRHTGEFKVRNLANGTYQVVLASQTFIDFFDEFLEGDSCRAYPLFEDKYLDERGHYMIRQHHLWIADRSMR